MKETPTSTTAPQQFSLAQAKPGTDLSNAINAKAIDTKTIGASDLNNLLAPISNNQALNPQGVAQLTRLTNGLESDQALNLLNVLGQLSPKQVDGLLDQFGNLSDEQARLLLKLLNSSGGTVPEPLLQLFGDPKNHDLSTLMEEARFFGVSDPRDLDGLNDVQRFFGFRDLRDRDLDDQLRLLRFFDLDDLRDLRFRINRIESGRASPSVNISNTGNNANLCLGIQQVVNTGNVANQQGVFQYNNEDGDGFLFDRGDRGFLFDRGDRGFLFDRGDRDFRFGDRFGFFDDFDNNDINFEGSSIEINPDQVVECQQTIIQAAASGIPLAQPSRALAAAPATPVAAVASGAGVAGPSVGLPVARGAGLAQLPRTGGLTLLPLVALGLTALGGGLIFWRLRRR